jgi:hypothetical protein
MCSSIEKEKFVKLAEELVALAKLIAVGSYNDIVKVTPQLSGSFDLKKWDLFCTVVSVYAAYSRTELFCKDKSLILELEEIVFNNLRKFDPNAMGALEDFESFLNKILNENPDDLTEEFVEASAGAWIIWNFTQKTPIQNEGKIAVAIGKFFFTSFANYYGQNSDK